MGESWLCFPKLSQDPPILDQFCECYTLDMWIAHTGSFVAQLDTGSFGSVMSLEFLQTEKCSYSPTNESRVGAFDSFQLHGRGPLLELKTGKVSFLTDHAVVIEDDIPVTLGTFFLHLHQAIIDYGKNRLYLTHYDSGRKYYLKLENMSD